MKSKDKILFIPSARKGNGTGHLKRCVLWSSELPAQNFYIPESPESFSPEEIEGITDSCLHKNIIRRNPGSSWDLIILDNRCTDVDYLPQELRDLPIIAIDESGFWRRHAAYTMDLLPAPYGKNSAANRTGLSFLDLPQHRERTGKIGLSSIHNVLVSFGGEDPAGLTQKIIDSLCLHETGWSWTFIQGPSFHQNLKVKGECGKITLRNSPDNLKDSLYYYDLVLTSFGLTAFEALSAGAEVLLINPSDYHDRLSVNAGFPLIKRGWKKKVSLLFQEIDMSLMKKNFFDQNKMLRETQNFTRESFTDWISSLTPGNVLCPVCGSSNNQLLQRCENKTYFRCRSKNCSMVYMLNYMEKQDLYSTAYFFEDYKKQYGKTYLQDFQNIKQSGFSRLENIEKLRSSHKTLLDIGCAFGPFLSAAADRGFKCYGLDVSEDAVEYINKNLDGIKAVSTPFESFNPEEAFKCRGFDIISLWYVIEHFREPSLVLKRIHTLINSGGILAVSTPNGRGVSGTLNRKHFLNISPDDHYTIWDRKSARKILTNAGFNQIRFVTTGYHPERIPVKLPFRKILNKSILLWISKMFRLGDTFEIYAVKKGIS